MRASAPSSSRCPGRGTIAAGKAADIIAVNGDPLVNVRELESVDFVMRAGKVFKN